VRALSSSMAAPPLFVPDAGGGGRGAGSRNRRRALRLPLALTPCRNEFDLKGAAQCAFCTPGILRSAAALLAWKQTPTRAEIQESLSGDLCRCTGCTKIYDALEAAAARLTGPVGAANMG